MRHIQDSIGRGVVSHTTIHKALRGPKLPSWGIVELLVEELAKKAQQNPYKAVEDFRILWMKEAGRQMANSDTSDTATKAKENARARPLSQTLLRTLDQIEAVGAREVGAHVLPTGFYDLDALTGGLRAGSLTVLGSGPSIGKTTLALDISRSTSMRFGLSSAFFSTEMTDSELQMRLLSAEARVSLHWLRSGFMQDEDWTRLARVIKSIADSPLWLLHQPLLSIKTLAAEIRALKEDHHLKLAVVDSLQPLISASRNDGSAATSGDTLRQLKNIALESEIPIVVTSRISHSESHSYQRPQVTDLQDWEAIQEEADLVILLYRPDAYDREHPRAGEIDFIIAKQRNGPTASVTAAFQAHYSRIVDFGGSDHEWSVKKSS